MAEESLPVLHTITVIMYVHICMLSRRARYQITAFIPLSHKKRVRKKELIYHPVRRVCATILIALSLTAISCFRDVTPYGTRFDPSFAVDADSGDLTRLLTVLARTFPPKRTCIITTPSPIRGFADQSINPLLECLLRAERRNGKI